MRKIKFRGKRIDNGEWVYGFYVYTSDLHRIIYEDYEGYYCEEVVDPATVGQATGLTDSKGNEIYEGDVIKAKDPYHHKEKGQIFYFCEVVFTEGALFMLKRQYNNCGTNRVEYFSICIMEVEVIGNIHDNPELLET